MAGSLRVRDGDAAALPEPGSAYRLGTLDPRILEPPSRVRCREVWDSPSGVSAQVDNGAVLLLSRGGVAGGSRWGWDEQAAVSPHVYGILGV